MHAGNHMGIMTTFKKPTAESGRGVGAVCAEETASGNMHAIRVNTTNHGRHIITLPPETHLSAPCPLLLQPHLFHKQVSLVIEAMIFHPLSIGLVEGITADIHPLHLLSEPTLDVGTDLLVLSQVFLLRPCAV